MTGPTCSTGGETPSTEGLDDTAETPVGDTGAVLYCWERGEERGEERVEREERRGESGEGRVESGEW